VVDGKRPPLLIVTRGKLGSMFHQRLCCMIMQGLFMSLGFLKHCLIFTTQSPCK